MVSIPYLTRVSQAPVIKDKKELEGKHWAFFTEFPTKEGETVEMKVGYLFRLIWKELLIISNRK